MSVDAHAPVVLNISQAQDLSPDLGSLLELGTVVVEARETPEDREELGERTFALEDLEGAGIRLLHLLCVTVGSHQRPSQTRPQRDLLHPPLWRRGRGGEDVQEL